jgi:hypothetical protein
MESVLRVGGSVVDVVAVSALDADDSTGTVDADESLRKSSALDTPRTASVRPNATNTAHAEVNTATRFSTPIGTTLLPGSPSLRG